MQEALRVIVFVACYLLIGLVLVCLCNALGINPFAFEDWNRTADNFTLGYCALFWPAFLILWLGKLFIFYPLLYVSEALGWVISHCGVCGKAR